MHTILLALAFLTFGFATIRPGDDTAKDENGLVEFYCKEGNCSMKLPTQPRVATSKTVQGETRSYRVISADGMYMFSVVDISDLKMTEEQIQKRLDDTAGMMNTMGLKLTSSKKVTLGKHPGIDVSGAVEKTARKEDIEAARVRVFVADSKLYSFMALGKRTYVESKRTAIILESLKLDSDKK